MCCDTCQHWHFIRGDYGECHLIDESLYEESPPPDYPAPDAAAWIWTTAKQDRKDVGRDVVFIEPNLMTKSGFGCTLHETKTD